MNYAVELEPSGERQKRRRLTDVPFKSAKRSLVEPFEREYIAELLERHDLNLSAASRASGLSRKHLRYLMRKYGIATPRIVTESDVHE